jgi:CelD/BcsL family acetyltransferase involved in cellulose biosynthesis
LLSAAAIRPEIEAEAAPPPAAMDARVRAEIVDADRLPDSWRGAWDRLAGQASEVNVFAESWFFEAGFRHLRGARPIRLVGIWQGSDLIGLLPVRIEHQYGRVPVAHVQNWLHHQTFLGTPLVRTGEETAFWEACLRALDVCDWARGFFHVSGLVEDGPVHRGLAEAARRLGRPCAIVHRSSRALLETSLSPAAYYEQAVRKKKRKEIGRLSSRLRELGAVEVSSPASPAEIAACCDEFLALEASGWKGRAGSALASDAAKRAFFRDAVAGAERAGRLEILRLALDGRAIAMLVNFLAPPGAFTFKIAFDEEFARFSPGVLIQREYLRVLDRADIAWTDSCAAENHPMINSLWTERRTIVRATVPLSGRRRRIVHAAARAVERGSAAFRRLSASAKGAA